MQLFRSAHSNRVGKKAARKLGVLGSLLDRRSGLSVINGVLVSKQHIGPLVVAVCVPCVEVPFLAD